MKSRSFVQASLAIVLFLSMYGCSSKVNEVSTNPSAKDGAASDTVVGKSTAVQPASAAQPADEKSLSVLSEKLTKVKLDKLPNNLVICHINDTPVTMGDYRHQFKNEQQQVQASLTMNPHLKDNLLSIAHEQKIVLNANEKKHLLDAAGKMQSGGTKGFNKMLADNQMTKKQFDDQVLEVGLACKVANAVIEATLLDELINGTIMREAAKKNGFSKEALNKYVEVSKSPEYKRLIAVGGFAPDELRNEIINNELCLKQIEKIKSESPLTDSELRDYYEKNKSKFKHGARIRLSQIYISLAGQEIGTAKDVRDKLKKDNPKLSDAEIDKRIADLQQQKYQLVQSLLKRAQKGEDFAALANQYSEDLVKSKQKNGGDLGFQEESKLNKDFANRVSKVPVGNIAGEVIVSPFGYHIFKVTAKEAPGVYKFEEVKDELKQLLSEQKGQQVVNNWLAKERKESKIVISPEIQNALSSSTLQKRELVATKPITVVKKSDKK